MDINRIRQLAGLPMLTEAVQEYYVIVENSEFWQSVYFIAPQDYKQWRDVIMKLKTPVTLRSQKINKANKNLEAEPQNAKGMAAMLGREVNSDFFDIISNKATWIDKVDFRDFTYTKTGFHDFDIEVGKISSDVAMQYPELIFKQPADASVKSNAVMNLVNSVEGFTPRDELVSTHTPRIIQKAIDNGLLVRVLKLVKPINSKAEVYSYINDLLSSQEYMAYDDVLDDVGAPLNSTGKSSASAAPSITKLVRAGYIQDGVVPK